MAQGLLQDDAIEERLGGLDGWSRDGDALVREWRFNDYAHAVLFTNAVAHLADEHDHHPDVTLGYGRVLVRLTSHDAGGITERDVRLAAAVDALPVKRHARERDA